MNTIYVLMVVMSVGSTARPVAFSQEFFSQKTCNVAAAAVRNSAGSVFLAFCTEK